MKLDYIKNDFIHNFPVSQYNFLNVARLHFNFFFTLSLRKEIVLRRKVGTVI